MALTPPRAREKRSAYIRSRYNPHKERSNAEYQRATRTIKRINDRFENMMEITDYQVRPWLPHEGFITDDDEMRQLEILGIYDGDLEWDHFMHIDAFNDQGIKATNRIYHIATFINSSHEQFTLKKAISSPLPCSTWGSYPLTRAQWNIIAMSLILSRHLWQWTPAVRHRTGDDSFEVHHHLGWHLDICTRVEPTGPTAPRDSHRAQEIWPGNSFYLEDIKRFSQEQRAEGIKCPAL